MLLWRTRESYPKIILNNSSVVVTSLSQKLLLLLTNQVEDKIPVYQIFFLQIMLGKTNYTQVEKLQISLHIYSLVMWLALQPRVSICYVLEQLMMRSNYQMW